MLTPVYYSYALENSKSFVLAYLQARSLDFTPNYFGSFLYKINHCACVTQILFENVLFVGSRKVRELYLYVSQSQLFSFAP